MSKIHFFLISLLAIVISLPLLLPLFRPQFFHMHDYTHVARLHEMDLAVREGHFPVRWSKNLGYGYGLPQFNFYAPLPYYIAEGLHLLGFSLLNAVKGLIVLNFIFGFIAVYYAVSQIFGKWAGLLSGVAFLYAPYRAVDVYVRGALGELTGITFMAVSLAAIVLWYKRRSLRAAALAGLSLAAIVASHNLMGLIGVPALLLIWLILLLIAESHKIKEYLPHLLIGALIAVGASAFYALPALAEKDYTRVGTLTSGFSNYAHHFVYLRQFIHSPWGYGGSIWGIEDDISFEIGKIQVFLGIIAGMYLLTRFKELKSSRKALLVGSTIIIIGSICMANHKSKFLWDALPLIDFLQFPWRFLSLVLLFAAVMAGISVAILKHGWQKMAWVLTFSLLLVTFNTRLFKPKEYLDDNQALYYTAEQRIAEDMSGVIPDFMPDYGAELPLEVPEQRFELIGTQEEPEVIVDRTHEFLVKVKPEQATQFRANIAYFPGWELYLNGQETPFTKDLQTGAMSFIVEPQKEAVEIAGRFTETPLRKISNSITLITLLGCSYLLFIQSGKEQKNT